MSQPSVYIEIHGFLGRTHVLFLITQMMEAIHAAGLHDKAVIILQPRDASSPSEPIINIYCNETQIINSLVAAIRRYSDYDHTFRFQTFTDLMSLQYPQVPVSTSG